MRSQCTNSTSGRKSVTGNKFSDVGFLYDREILAVRCRTSSILAIFTAHVQFRPHYYFRFKIWRHIWIQCARNFGRTTPLSATIVAIMSAHAKKVH